MITDEQRISADKFQELHTGAEMFLLPNIWDAGSAYIFEKQGFQALATTSAGIAYSLGYPDGEKIPFEDLLFIVKSMVRRIKVPLSVDFERGYGESLKEFKEFSRILLECGIAGLNIEDGRPDNTLDNIELMKNKIEILLELKKELNLNFVINARTCACWLKIGDERERLETAVERGNIFKKSGADSVFIPGVEDENAVKMLAEKIDIPLNFLINSKLYDFEKYKKLGAKRLTLGSGTVRYIMERLINTALDIKNGDVSKLTDNTFTYKKANEFFKRIEDIYEKKQILQK
jgi:2-methylisocitrate lyase-like PEP mutase family enzyme